jgi:hypothetical protein
MNTRRARLLSILLCATAFNLASRAQDTKVSDPVLPQPIDVTIHELAAHPKTFDGRLVRVYGVPTLGWEGDNFLREWPEQKKGGPASLWFYCPAKTERETFALLDAANVRGRSVLFVFTGYFHFAPKSVKEREVFDPGPLHLEVLRASRLSGRPDY